MEDARSILKECGEFIGQAASTVPRSAKVAQPGRVGVAASGAESILVPSKDEEETAEVSGSKVSRLLLQICTVLPSPAGPADYDYLSAHVLMCS